MGKHLTCVCSGDGQRIHCSRRQLAASQQPLRAQLQPVGHHILCKLLAVRHHVRSSELLADGGALAARLLGQQHRVDVGQHTTCIFTQLGQPQRHCQLFCCTSMKTCMSLSPMHCCKTIKIWFRDNSRRDRAFLHIRLRALPVPLAYPRRRPDLAACPNGQESSGFG